MTEQFAQVGESRLCYQVVGDGDVTVVLVMGLNLQLIWWRDDFCQGLVDRGMRVVRFDNRDVGRSSTFPATRVTAWNFLTRMGVRPAYGLQDMARDTAGLIAQVAPRGSHLVGVSLGALIAQQVAIDSPAQALSLTSIMGRPGDGRTGKVAWSARRHFLAPPRRGLDAQADQLVRTLRRIGSTGRTDEDDQDVRLAVRRAAVRGAAGNANQLAAVLTEQDRTAGLNALRIPALVVHGRQDRIILPSGGRATAAAVPGAELLEVAGMGHDLPRHLWPLLWEGIERTVRRAGTDLPGAVASTPVGPRD